MTLAQYTSWKSQDSPWSLTGPLRQVLADLDAVYVNMVWGALGDMSHMLANPPEDHTPYSATGWPYANPYPVVHALDVMNGNGVNCQALFNYWIVEARAGRMPWLKYMIWQATLYSIRSTPAWTPQSNEGHFDHIHLSARTDTEAYRLGSWSPVPPMSPPIPGVKTMNFFGVEASQTQYVADSDFYNFWAFNDTALWQAVRAAAGNPTPHAVPQAYVDGGAFGTYRGIYTMPHLPPPSNEGTGVTPEQVRIIADARIAGSKVVPSAS